MYFLDSSSLTKAFVAETGTEAVASLLEQTEAYERVFSALAALEVRSAIRRRERNGEILPHEADRAILALEKELAGSEIIPVDAKSISYARQLLDRHDLRTLDALQLTAAVTARSRVPGVQPFIIVCSDSKLLFAAEQEGFQTLNPGDATKASALRNL